MSSMRSFQQQNQRRRQAGFTLIEVLVVVAIIALLVAILIPSLARAREMARMTVCLSNMSNLPKAVHVFAADHRGWAQLIGEPDEWPILDPGYKKYEYQAGCFTRAGMYTKPWPVAYARALGLNGLKRAEQYFLAEEAGGGGRSRQGDPAYFFSRFGRQEIFICPSDKVLVNNVWSPFEMYGIISYAPNEDVFGVTHPNNKEGQPWADGTSGDDYSSNGPRAKRLEGRMDKIVDPSTVGLFVDGGNEDNRDEPALLITNPSNKGIHGPYLENYEWSWGRLPHRRHLEKGGIACAMADGSGKLARAARWKKEGAVNYVQHYAPRIRVSPYKVGAINPTQP